MNEVQGPTPTGSSRPYKSLAEALRAHRIDPANHDFIGAIAETVGISTFIDRGRYIEAVRRGEGAPLHIGKTYTNGFAEDEQVLVAGRVLPMSASDGRAPYFYVRHPSAILEVPIATKGTTGATVKRAAGSVEPRPKPEARTTRPANLIERDYGTCDVCFMVRNAAGRCGCD